MLPTGQRRLQNANVDCCTAHEEGALHPKVEKSKMLTIEIIHLLYSIVNIPRLIVLVVPKDRVKILAKFPCRTNTRTERVIDAGLHDIDIAEDLGNSLSCFMVDNGTLDVLDGVDDFLRAIAACTLWNVAHR